MSRNWICFPLIFSLEMATYWTFKPSLMINTLLMKNWYTRTNTHTHTHTTQKGHLLYLFQYGGRCSVLIKVVPGYENIYASHSTYATFFIIHNSIRLLYFLP